MTTQNHLLHCRKTTIFTFGKVTTFSLPLLMPLQGFLLFLCTVRLLFPPNSQEVLLCRGRINISDHDIPLLLAISSYENLQFLAEPSIYMCVCVNFGKVRTTSFSKLLNATKTPYVSQNLMSRVQISLSMNNISLLLVFLDIAKPQSREVLSIREAVKSRRALKIYQNKDDGSSNSLLCKTLTLCSKLIVTHLMRALARYLAKKENI